MSAGVFTRSVGMRLAIVGTAHPQARDLDHGLEPRHRSVDILTRSSPPGPRTTSVSSTPPSPPGGANPPCASSSSGHGRSWASPPDGRNLEEISSCAPRALAGVLPELGRQGQARRGIRAAPEACRQAFEAWLGFADRRRLNMLGNSAVISAAAPIASVTRG